MTSTADHGPDAAMTARAVGLTTATRLLPHLPGYRVRGWTPWGGWENLWLLLVPDDPDSPTVALGLRGAIWLVAGASTRQVVDDAASSMSIGEAVGLVLAAFDHTCTPTGCAAPTTEEFAGLRLVAEIARAFAVLGLGAADRPVQLVETPDFDSATWSLGTPSRHFVVDGLRVWEVVSGRWVLRSDLRSRQATIAQRPAAAAHELLAQLGLPPAGELSRTDLRRAVRLLRWGTT